MDYPDRFKTGAAETDEYRIRVDRVADYAVYMLNAQGVVVNWTPGNQRYQGYEATDVLGEHFSRFFMEDDRKAGLPERALAIATREGVFENEGWRLRKDGSRLWAHMVIHPVRAPLGTLVGYAVITHDLSERRATQEALRKSEEQFRILVQGVTDYAIYMLEPDGRVATWNSGAERIKGYRADEIIGQNFTRFYTPAAQAEGAPRRTLEIAAREGRYEEQGWRMRKDGGLLWANVVIDAIRNADGVLTGFAKVTRDLTERSGLVPSLPVPLVRFE